MIASRIRPVSIALAHAVLVWMTATEVNAASALVRWRPVADSRVAGYQVYVRQAGKPYDAPREAGLPSPATDGSLSYLVTGLSSATTYHFTVVARLASGITSGISGELVAGAQDPCRRDRCVTLTNCDFNPASNGTPCGDGLFCNGPERCNAGVCRNGTPPGCDDGVACTSDTCDDAIGACRHDGPPACCLDNVCQDNDPCAVDECEQTGCTDPLRGDLSARRLKLRVDPDGTYVMVARGAFHSPVELDPTQDGITFDLADPFGLPIYRAHVPGIRLRQRNNRFTYVATEADPQDRGVTDLSLRRAGEGYKIIVRATGSDLATAVGQPSLTIALRFEEGQCVRQMHLACRTLLTGLMSCAGSLS